MKSGMNVFLAASSQLEDEESHDRERDQKNGQNQTAQHERNQLPLFRSGLGDAKGVDEDLGQKIQESHFTSLTRAVADQAASFQP